MLLDIENLGNMRQEQDPHNKRNPESLVRVLVEKELFSQMEMKQGDRSMDWIPLVEIPACSGSLVEFLVAETLLS